MTWNVDRAGREKLKGILDYIRDCFTKGIVLLLQEAQNLGTESPLPGWEFFHEENGYTAIAVTADLKHLIRNKAEHTERASSLLIRDWAAVSSYLPDSWKRIEFDKSEVQKVKNWQFSFRHRIVTFYAIRLFDSAK